jgi:endo-1,4-beta-xylanase
LIPADHVPEFEGRAGQTRRALLLSALALSACDARAAPEAPTAALESAPFPLGVAAMTGQFDDRGWTELVAAQFDRVTPEWEMKMEAVLEADGALDFSRPDRLVAAAEARGLTVFGHTLIWYAQSSAAFERLAGDRAAFAAAYRKYVLDVAGRYRGRLAGWDVVNEPVNDDGEGYRDCLWRQALGMDYVRLAFEHAREADPVAPLLMNDYNLERPKKRAAFLRLAEGLLKAGAPLSGLGTQTHLIADLEPGAIRATVRELSSLGLPVHVSELDVSHNAGRMSALRRGELEARQTALVAEAVEAIMELPESQRFGLTVWGARDKDSWLRRPPNASGPLPDRPLLFDDDGRPKAAARAFAKALA